MTSNVLTLNVTDSLEDAESIMKKNKVRHIPVVSGEKLVGMLSLTDLLRISFVDHYGEQESSTDTVVYDILSIPQVMVSNPEFVTKDQTIREVAEMLATKEYHALPVVEEGNLVGIVTTTDLIKYLLDQY
ncbi:MAG: CBS domain-containing protein [Chitinophagales bacterium]